MTRKVVIIGGLSAIAEATARILAESGASIALLARSPERLDAVAKDLQARGASRVVSFALDLASANPVEALAAARERLDGLDTVMLFYGLLGEQPVAERDLTQARTLLDVNFTSAALWMLASAAELEHGEDRRRRTLLAVSSVAGDRGRRSNFIYGAAKGGLSILMQGLAHRFAALRNGPRAVTMKLGFVDTPMTAAIAKGGPLWAKPADVARSIVRALDRGGPIVYAPGFWRWIMLAIRLTPSFVFNRVNL